VSDADSYILEEDDNESFSSPTEVYSGPGTSKYISGKAVGTYYYRVKAANCRGSGDWSSVQSVRVWPIPAAPNLNPISNPDCDGDYTVSWSSATDATSYDLQEDDNAGFSSPSTVYSGPDTSKAVTGKGGGTWYYRARGCNCRGCSDWSSTQSAYVMTIPTVDPIDNSGCDGNYTVSWSTVPGATEYTLEEDDNSSFSSPTTVYQGPATSTSISGNNPNTYYYRVRASSATCTSPWSSHRSVIVDDLTPPSITNIWETDDPIKEDGCPEPTTVTIRADVTDASGLAWVRLYYEPPGGSWTPVTMSHESGNTYKATIGPFSQAGTLYYYVKARDNADANNEDQSSTYTVTVDDCPTPLVLVHGFNGSCVDGSFEDSFKHLEDWLEKDGYKDNVYCANPVASLKFLPPLSVNALRLAADIAEIKGKTGAGEVIIIAHSLGGLIARAYIESSLYQNDVARLYVLGSPNGGFWLATMGIVPLCSYGSSGCELTILGMKLFNFLHWPKRPESLPYRFIAGTAQNRNWKGKVLGDIIPGPDDATVRVASVHALDGDALVKYTSMETHSSGLGEPSYFDPDSGSQSYRECIRPELLDDTGTCPQSVLSVSEMAAEPEPSLNSLIASFTGVITTGYTISHTVSVDTSGVGTFNLFWVTGALAFSLTSPTGTVIDPAYAQTSPDVEYGQAPITDSITAAAMYYITNTMPGTWTLTVSGVDTGAEGVLYGANVVVESDVLLGTVSDRDLYTIGDTAIVTASLTAGGTGVSEATVQVTIHRPDGVAETIPLFDDGAHNDGAVADGTYGGSYTIPAVSGYYTFRASAEGVLDIEAFRREAQGIFIVASEAASLTDSYTDYPVDEDGDGRYEWLALDMGVDANRAGDYTLSAQLVGGDGSFVSHVLTYTIFATGTQTVTIYFDGEDILKSDVDGPYTVTEVYLMDDSGASIPADIEMDVWTTAAYDHRQFGTLERVYLPLILKNYS